MNLLNTQLPYRTRTHIRTYTLLRAELPLWQVETQIESVGKPGDYRFSRSIVRYQQLTRMSFRTRSKSVTGSFTFTFGINAHIEPRLVSRVN